jgi:hypothetical protein
VDGRGGHRGHDLEDAGDVGDADPVHVASSTGVNALRSGDAMRRNIVAPPAARRACVGGRRAARPGHGFHDRPRRGRELRVGEAQRVVAGPGERGVAAAVALDHLVDALRARGDAALCASIFHYGTCRVAEAKAHLAAAG